MRTVMRSLMAKSLSCLGEGFDEEAADVEKRAEKREKDRRDAMVYVKGAAGIITRDLIAAPTAV
jgi:hypothetical protein